MANAIFDVFVKTILYLYGIALLMLILIILGGILGWYLGGTKHDK